MAIEITVDDGYKIIDRWTLKPEITWPQIVAFINAYNSPDMIYTMRAWENGEELYIPPPKSR